MKWIFDPKLLSLVVLSVQNTTLVLAMRISRTRENVPMYLSSVAVMTDELMKLAVCIVMLVWAYGKYGQYQLVSHETTQAPSFIGFMKQEVFKSWFDFVKMSVPALLYAVQKNLLYLAISNLDAAVFQVAYQGKILTTALFSVIVLKKRLSYRQVVALVILLLGVALVQLSSLDTKAASSLDVKSSGGILVGIMAVTAACCTSGFAAIYFEWVLKKQTLPHQEPYALWVRNFQLAVFAALSAGIGVFTKDYAAVRAHGLYQGFTALVWFVVATEAFGGIVVALVIKYADNILKNFATAVSIVTSVIVSALFLNFSVKLIFVIGTACVLGAVVLYTSNPKTPLFTRPHDKYDEEQGRVRSVSSGIELIPAANPNLKSRGPAPEPIDEKAEI